MFGSGRRRPDPGVVDFIRRTLFENPWADAELSSFVAEDDGGRIVGFITVGPPRMRLESGEVELLDARLPDELARGALSGDALLTRLEGEWSGEQLG
jgi:hypothetical protein